MKRFTYSFGSCNYNVLHFVPSGLPVKQIIDCRFHRDIVRDNSFNWDIILFHIGIRSLLQYHNLQIKIVFAALKQSIMKDRFIWTVAYLLRRKSCCHIIFYISLSLLKMQYELLGLHFFHCIFFSSKCDNLMTNMEYSTVMVLHSDFLLGLHPYSSCQHFKVFEGLIWLILCFLYNFSTLVRVLVQLHTFEQWIFGCYY